jgi:hypothetical protein
MIDETEDRYLIVIPLTGLVSLVEAGSVLLLVLCCSCIRFGLALQVCVNHFMLLVVDDEWDGHDVASNCATFFFGRRL